MTTLPHLLLQPRSRRSQQRRCRHRVILAILFGVTVAGGAYLLH
ncbi:MAG: hypothetical protein ACRYG7_00795 [Janthinobacterium lividum]